VNGRAIIYGASQNSATDKAAFFEKSARMCQQALPAQSRTLAHSDIAKRSACAAAKICKKRLGRVGSAE